MDLFLDPTFFSSTVRVFAPILLAALGGAICARVGLFNVALEGLMLLGAFSAIVANYYFENALLATLVAALCSAAFSMILAYLSIGLRANAIVVGIALNFLALGLTTFCLRAIFQVKGAYYDREMVGLPHLRIPYVEDIPVLGAILSGHTPLVYFAVVAAAATWYYFFRTVSGFRFLASGENPLAAQSFGIRVKRMQYGAVLCSGLLCGLAGAQLSLGQVTMFAENMTAGRGFIALVATMLGQSHPFGVAASSLLFGLMESASNRLQGFSMPSHFTQMLPYAMTIVAMIFFKDKGFAQEAQRMNGSNR